MTLQLKKKRNVLRLKRENKVMHSKSDNIEIMIKEKPDEGIEKIFESLLN